MADYCEKHSEHSACLTNLKLLHQECKRERREETALIFAELRKRPSFMVFFWVMGAVITITGGLIAANFEMLTSINEKVAAIAQIQQYELGRAAKERGNGK